MHATAYVLLFRSIYWNYFLESRQHISTDLSRTGYNLPPEETYPTRTCPWLL